ncbi:PREDICTED: EF-hand calcium-binding domain-containing protein 6 isoform X1 [Miniopterus natalensis]|uniref:EF-hand calcium-binding domain-containing protein 6 isoform X1 n=1 Tax=Miniopterus natalensis TaxID=291302 RepID=UPI0007A6CC0C|nr:PREDICTED: EF-hand calcium-binding domain-containing protein 6 isoform X1 [Miniopterus natalensis]
MRSGRLPVPLTSSGAVLYLQFLSRFGGMDLNINVIKRSQCWPCEAAAEMSAAWAAGSLLASREQEELEDLPHDYPLSLSEDEGDSDGERKHQKLLEAISSLGKSGRKLAERSEACLEVSAFALVSGGSGERLALPDLLHPSVQTSPSGAAVRKQLDRVKSRKTVEVPCSQEEAQRVRREAALRETSQALSRWDPIVLRNRQAEQLVFPLEKEPSAFAPTELVLSGWKAGTPLERDIFKLLYKNRQPARDPLLTPMDKASLQAMSLEEAQMRRAELQRARALQSYYEARARREKKIKSKMHRRDLRKGKARKGLGEVEELRKVSSSAALGELAKLKKARMMERMSLRHQSCGKWAKSKKIMAKYDLEARQAVQEQLTRNRGLTQKLQVAPESEEEEGGAEEDGDPLVLDAATEAQRTAGESNPWMVRSHPSDTEEAESREDPKLIPEPAAHEASESEGEEGPVAEEVLLKEFGERRLLRKKSGLYRDTKPVGRQEAKDSGRPEVLSEWRALPQELSEDDRPARKQKVSSAGTVLQVGRERPAGEEEEPLWLQLQELGRGGRFQNKEPPGPALEGQLLEGNPDSQRGACKEEERKQQMIDLQNFLTPRSPSVEPVAAPTAVEASDEQERAQKQMVKEAFVGDDVIRDFLEERREAVEASKAKDVDLALPGWGEWGGAGLKPGARKRHRFLVKAPEGPPRKDRNLPNVILSEKRNIHAAAHQVRVLPYPFTHHWQFERTIQTPVGSTWNTQRAFQKLTTPRVVTMPGHIIEPIKAEDVGFRSSRADLRVIQRNPKRLSTHHRKQLEKSSKD